MNNNYPYQRPYNVSLNEQGMYDQITGQINQLQQMREQIKNNMQLQQQHQQQPTSINQTFQLAPNSSNGIKYASSLDEVNRETVFVDTPFFSKDMSVLWVKTPQNEVKAYELNEIVEKDEKDLQIEFLMAQIEELKKGMKKDDTKPTITNDDEPVKSKESSSIPVSQPSKATKK